jgi:hypothetical protein
MGQERLDQAPRDLATARRAQGVADEAFRVLRHGETFRPPPPPPAPAAAP